MDLIVDLVAVVGLSGVIAMSVLAPAIGLAMPVLILVGAIDGPTGGRLQARSTNAARRVTASVTAEEPSPAHAPRRPAA
jgi:hypothetical protein